MYERILVPVDGSDTSRRGLREAVALAKTQGSSIRLVGSRPLTAEAAADLRESFAASDNDGDGFIHLAEFDYLLDTVGSRLLPAARVLEFRSIDKDGDGLIDIQEFTAWCGR